MSRMQERIRDFWDSQPCGTTHINLPPQSREYFIEFDKYFEGLYPYYFPFLNLESMRGKRVMEIGLGSGASLHRIAQVAKACFGLDLSGSTIELNQTRNKHFNLGVKLIHASATEIPLADNSLDVVVSVGCIHHIPDIEKVVTEIHRILKPGGVFKGMVYHRNSYRLRIAAPLKKRSDPEGRDRTWQDSVREYDGAENPYGTAYSKADMLKLLHKFSPIEFQQQNFAGEDVSRRLGARIPRNVWLATLGRVAGLDLYFTARAVK
jgi:SAM-dependent methyltransferase